MLISKAMCPHEPLSCELERGRILQVTCITGGGRLDVFTVHNFDIGGHVMRRVAAALREVGARHAEAPHRHRGITMGDFNFEARGHGSRAPRSRADRILDCALQSWTELSVSGATHMTPDSARFSAIDRVWVLLPRSLLATARPHVTTRVRPERVHHMGLSDHAPLEVT